MPLKSQRNPKAHLIFNFLCTFNNSSYLSGNKKSINLGLHNTEEEAHLFYKKALENKRHFNGNVESFKRLIGCHRIHFSSKVKGISFDKRRGKWRIRPIMNGFRKSFGYAETEKEAIEILNNIIK